jgi:hypothetical protein
MSVRGSSFPLGQHPLVAATALALLACSSASDSSTSNGPLDANGIEKKFKLADGVLADWKTNAKPEAYHPIDVYTADKLTDRIDGGAPAYTSRGCRLAMYQQMVGPDPASCIVVSMDFVAEDQARSMVDYQRQQASASVRIPPYESDVAIAAEALTGITVFARFKSMYFELQIDGVPDPSAAVKLAGQFLAQLQTKAN